MKPFVSRWADAATTGVGLFYTAFWAFALGYFVSSLIQVFVTRERMRRLMGTTGPRSVGLGTLFGFVSSSCSFAALSTTRALFARGAGLVPSMAFLLASTNLVVELGIVIALFLAWPFVLAEYVGGLLLIAFAGAIIALTRPSTLIDEARRHAQDAEGGHDHGGGDHDRGRSIWRGLRSPTAWRQVAETYVAEWRMVYQDVTLGFTVAGIIAVFVPASFFAALFPGAPASHPSLGEVVGQALIGPVAAFFTFIGSMGNIPLAAVLFGHGVSFAGVMAFIFSDLVVLPVLRIQARYYGWKMALYLLGVMLASLVSVAVLMHYGFDALGWLPTSGGRAHMAQRSFFSLDGTLLVNLACLVASLGAYLWTRERDEAEDGGASSPTPSLGARVMRAATALCGLWLLAGLGLALVTDASPPARRMPPRHGECIRAWTCKPSTANHCASSWRVNHV